MADEPTPGGAKPPESDPASGARPAGDSNPAGAKPPGEGDGKGAMPDTPLGDDGKAALEKEREARREAERRAAQARDRITELEDAGKSELDRALAQLKRAEADRDAATARTKELEGELSKRDLDSLKTQVANEFELPASVAKRLQGTDVRELRADAKQLKEELGSGTPVGSLGIGRGGAAAGGSRRVDMNTLIREAAGRG